MQHPVLPVESERLKIEAARRRGAVIITAPTGSGKSTQIPRWMMSQGTVLVIEPRRVACRALADWVAELEETPVGQRVGYAIRDEDKRSASTELLFVTPGVALRMLVESPDLTHFDTIIIDEFHERGWQVDVIVALLGKRRPKDVIVMSATLEAEPLVAYLDGTHVPAQGRRFPVEIHYDASPNRAPSKEDVTTRVNRAVLEYETVGDVLVFLPGKGEIRQVHKTLPDAVRRRYEVLSLHSSLSVAEQRLVFSKTSRPKLILSTNIAETSLTLTGVTLVIDSGLVRRTQYFQGRGFLGLVPIAQDAADQRAGRAGRVQSGVCVRLWSAQARLEQQTQPEVLREGLTPLVLAVLECGESPSALNFFTAPKPYAIAAALSDLEALGAVHQGSKLTRIGQELAGLPMDPHLGRLVVQAKLNSCAPAMVVLVSILGLQRPIQVISDEHPVDSERHSGCDVWRALSAYYRLDETLELSNADRARVQRTAQRVGRMLDVKPGQSFTIHDRENLARAAVMADGRFVFLKRQRRQRIYWSNGRAEAELGQRTTLSACLERGGSAPAAIVALEIFGLSIGQRRRTLQLNWVMPIPLSMVEGQVEGAEVLSNVRIGAGGLEGRFARIHAKRELGAEWRMVADGDVHDALVFGFLSADFWKRGIDSVRYQLSLRARSAFLNRQPLDEKFGSLECYLRAWLTDMGIETASDLLIVEPQDLLPTPLALYEREEILRRLPDEVAIGSKGAQLTYDLERRVAMLHMNKRWVKSAVNPRFLPAVEGFTIVVRDGTRQRMLRK